MPVANKPPSTAAPQPADAFALASDRDLLRNFAAVGDQAAFAELVRRHRAMLLRLSRRILRGDQDAEDICQAAFLLLARQAASVRWQASIAGWLYQVAYRLALKARTAAARRSRHEARAKPTVPPDPLAELTLGELQAVLDEELSRLPEKYRAPILLCCLEDRSRDEAARCLGWPIAAVKDRLEQGRERLRARLARRGLPLGTALLSAWLLGGGAQAASTRVVLPATADATAAAALAIRAGRAGLTDYLPARIAALAQGAIPTMFTRTATVAAAVVLALGLAAAGVVKGMQGDQSPAQPPPAKVDSPVKGEQPAAQPAPPLPAAMPLGGHTGVVHALALDRDGKLLASAGADKTVRLWDLTTGRQLHSLEQPSEAVAVAFSPDGTLLAALSAGNQGALTVFEVKTGKPLWRGGAKPKGAGAATAALAVSPDGKRLAVLSGGVQGYDLATGRLFFVLQLPAGKGMGKGAVAYSPDSQVLAVTDGAGQVLLVDSRTGNVTKLANPLQAQALAFLSNTKLAAADGGWAVRLVDMTTNKESTAFEGRDAVNFLALSEDGKWAATAATGGSVLVWDVAAAKQERRFTVPGPIHAVALGSDGKVLATAGAEGLVVWDLTRDEKPLPKDLKLTAKDLDAAWADLASEEAVKAYAGARLLQADPARAVPFLQGQLKPKVDKPAPERLKQLITDLDAIEFKKREAAIKELEKYGVLAEPALRKALTEQPPLEVKQRVERLLKILEGDGKPLTAAQQRDVRAVRILERINAAEARQLLDALVRESPGWWIRQEARAALKRLGQGDKEP
jgi:RNA polymerase sigma factor (sigma-70 family)